MNGAIKILEIFAAMANQRTRKRRPGLFGYFYGSGNEKLVVRSHAATSNIQPASAKLWRGRRSTFNRSISKFRYPQTYTAIQNCCHEFMAYS